MGAPHAVGEAYWLTGLRIVQYENPGGGVIYQSQRVTDQNTLIWSRDGFVFRIEGPLEKDAAVEIAGSLRQGKRCVPLSLHSCS